MLKVCNINIERRKKIFTGINIFLKSLTRKFRINSVYLFGSFARNEIHEGSDIDLLIVGNFNGRIFERINSVIGLTNLPIEPLAYTPEEFNRMRKSNSFIRKIIKTGKKIFPL